MNTEILYHVPLFLLFIILIALLTLASELGYRIGRKISDDNKNMPDIVPTAIFALLALLMGFTLSMAVTRYESRKNLIIQEANAISTMKLRAETMPKPYSTEARALIGQYLHETTVGLKTETGVGSVDAEKKLWSVILNSVEKQRDALSAVLIQSYNQMVDLRSEIIYQRQNHVPETVYYLIMIISIVGIGTLGYVSGYNGVRHIPTFILIFLLSLTIVLVQDVDRPTRGLIRIDRDVLKKMQAEF